MAMSQQGQSLARFPPTKLLEANYGSVLAQNTNSLQQLDALLSKKRGNKSSRDILIPPHQPIKKPLNCSLNASEKLESLKIELTHHISSLRRSITCQEQKILAAKPVIESLLAAAKSDPASAACVLGANSKDGPSLVVARQWGILKCAVGKDCGQRALPFSKFCLQHQSCDSAQVLYRNCTAIDSNSLTQCRKTAEDIFLDSPLCPKHALLEVANAPRKKTIHSLVRPAQKKVLSSKGGVTKTVRGRKILGQPKVSAVLKLKSGGEAKISAPAASWNTSKSSDGTSFLTGKPAEVTTATGESTKPVAASKSLDDLLTLGSSLTASVPKLDLLPLKADIGEFMMAGEDASSDEQT